MATTEWTSRPAARGTGEARGRVVLAGAATGATPTRDSQMCRPLQSQATCWPTGYWWTDLQSQPPCNNAMPLMAQARYAANVVVLPDGSLVVIGGGSGQANDTNSIERYYGGQWRPCAGLIAVGGVPGGYGFHSTAILLPDGSVLIGGGDAHNALRYDFQIYLPWYIAEGHIRPIIEKVNGSPWTPTTNAVPLSYGQTFTIQHKVAVGVAVTKVVLMRPGSATHGANSDQRYIELEIIPPVDEAPPGEITACMPAKPPSHPTITTSDVSGPPGDYMIFLVTSGGVPSEAAWVELKYP